MLKIRKILNILCFLALVGCATLPITLDERMNSKYALANDVGENGADEMRYRVGYQYANAARDLITDLEHPQVNSSESTRGAPLVTWSYTLQDAYDSRFGDPWSIRVGTVTPEEARNGTYFNTGFAMMAMPNTHYFLYEEGPGSASAEDVDATWKAAHALFSAIHNLDNRCEVARWHAEYQYALTQPKNVRGIYKQVVYLCPNPVANNEVQTVRVEAWANPFEGVRSMGAVQSQCWYERPRGKKYVDIRGCGESLARRQRALIPESRFEVMELITTPQRHKPSMFKVVARYKSNALTLLAPETNPKYIAFLEEHPYSPD